MAIECKHGQLARSCYTCELEAEIAELKNEWKVPTCKIGNGVSAYDKTQVRDYEGKVHRYILELENEVKKLRWELEELKKGE